MYVIHAHWPAAGSPCLWAEDSTASDVGANARRTSARPPAHPFAATPSAFAESVGIMTHDLSELVLRLPTVAREPLPSPELVRRAAERPPARQAAPRLLSWRIVGLRIPDAVRFGELLWLAQDHEDLVASGSLRWFAAVEEFADDLIGRGRVVPGIRDKAARWLPVLSGPDEGALRSLVEAMPAVCRAEDPEPAQPVVMRALDGLVDSFVRQRIGHLRLGPVVPRNRVSVAERWLRALSAADARMNLRPAADISGLTAGLATWHGALQAGAGPVRACFRLGEPADDDPATWRVEFLLQATDDPSLLIPADSVWAARANTLTTSYGVITNPQEALLTDLGRASRLFPELEAELRARQPRALELDSGGAQRFLREAAPLLVEAGFGVLLPSWWSSHKRKVGLKLSAKTTKQDAAVTAAGFGMSSLVDFRWELAIGDDTLSEEELAELARHKAPLVRVRGQWVEVDHGELARALEFVAERGTGQATASEVLAAAVHPDDAADGLQVSGVSADGWLGALLGGELAATAEPIGPSADFAGTLRPYQERGLTWLHFMSRLGFGACLADDMGLGKTPQALALLTIDTPKSPTLLVCPMSVVGNWQREAARFAPKLRVHVHHGGDRLDGEEFREAVGNADLVVTTYALAARDAQRLATVTWHRVILDEAQNIKNSQARQTHAVRTLPAAHRLALTGTPVENRLSELWSIMEFLNPGLLGPASAFRERFAVPIERRRDEEAAARLKRATQPFILRRVKTDKSIIDDLPDKIEMKVLCNLTPEQASLYQAIVDDMLGKIDDSEGMQRRGLVLATMVKLKQACNHPAQLLHDGSRLPGRSGKLARLEEIAEEVLADGDKALVFTQFAEFGGLLQPYLTGRLHVPVHYLHGGTSKKQRDALVDEFQTGAGPAIFVLSLKAGGTGLNLTAANHVIHFDRWWNPAVEDQATDRAFRIGQRKDVQVRKFVCVGTLEERIDAMIDEKKALAEMVVGTGEAWLTELSTDELRALVALDPDAVAE